MKNLIIVLLIFAIPLGVYAFLDTKKQNEMMCSTEVEKILKENNSKGKMIKFSSPMCSECQEVAAEMQKVPKELKDSIVIEEINVIESNKSAKDYNNQMIKKYKVSLVPTIVFLDKNGKLVKKQEGMMSKEKIIEAIEGIK